MLSYACLFCLKAFALLRTILCFPVASMHSARPGQETVVASVYSLREHNVYWFGLLCVGGRGEHFKVKSDQEVCSLCRWIGWVGGRVVGYGQSAPTYVHAWHPGLCICDSMCVAGACEEVGGCMRALMYGAVAFWRSGGIYGFHRDKLVCMYAIVNTQQLKYINQMAIRV